MYYPVFLGVPKHRHHSIVPLSYDYERTKRAENSGLVKGLAEKAEQDHAENSVGKHEGRADEMEVEGEEQTYAMELVEKANTLSFPACYEAGCLMPRKVLGSFQRTIRKHRNLIGNPTNANREKVKRSFGEEDEVICQGNQIDKLSPIPVQFAIMYFVFLSFICSLYFVIYYLQRNIEKKSPVLRLSCRLIIPLIVLSIYTVEKLFQMEPRGGGRQILQLVWTKKWHEAWNANAFGRDEPKSMRHNMKKLQYFSLQEIISTFLQAHYGLWGPFHSFSKGLPTSSLPKNLQLPVWLGWRFSFPLRIWIWTVFVGAVTICSAPGNECFKT